MYFECFSCTYSSIRKIIYLTSSIHNIIQKTPIQRDFLMSIILELYPLMCIISFRIWKCFVDADMMDILIDRHLLCLGDSSTRSWCYWLYLILYSEYFFFVIIWIRLLIDLCPNLITTQGIVHISRIAFEVCIFGFLDSPIKIPFTTKSTSHVSQSEVDSAVVFYAWSVFVESTLDLNACVWNGDGFYLYSLSLISFSRDLM